MGLVDHYFLAHCFHGYNEQCHVVSPQELYECLPWPSGTVLLELIIVNIWT